MADWGTIFADSFSTSYNASKQNKLKKQEMEAEAEKWKKTLLQDEALKMLGMGYEQAITPEQSKSMPLDQFNNYITGGTGNAAQPMTQIGGNFYKKNENMASGKPIFTIDETGNLKQVGNVPKGSQVVTPSAMMTPVAKAQMTMEMGAKANALKDTQLNLSKVQRLNPIIDSVETEWMKTNPLSSAQGGRLSGITKSAMAFTQTDPQASSYKSFIKGFRAQLARAMGDVGNLSEPEQKAAMDLVPLLSDTLEVGQEKLNKVRAFITNLEQGNEDAARALLGKDAKVMPQELQKAIESGGFGKVKSFKLIKE